MFPQRLRSPRGCAAISVSLAVAVSLASTSANAQIASTSVKSVGSVPRVLQNADNLGPLASEEAMRLTLWLHLSNEAAFDKALEDIYTPGSPTYHQWMSTAEFEKYAPSASDRKTVTDELTKQGLTVIDDDDPFAVKVRGTVADVQRTFHTQISNFVKNGQTFHANTTEAQLDGKAGSLVLGVSGLSSYGPRPFTLHQQNPKTGLALKPVSLATVKQSGAGLPGFFTGNCFSKPTVLSVGDSHKTPFGMLYGSIYGTGLICGFLPYQVQNVYGLKAAYAAGLQGEGQTIVIVAAYGSPTLESDANEFNTLTGLAQLTSSNFQIIYPDGPPLDPELGFQEGWNVESTLDLEWAHAIAPKAKIIVLAAASQDDESFQDAIAYATLHHLGSVISNSYGLPEIERGPATLQAYDLVIKLAAAAGISVDFASGDSGDFGLGSPVGAVESPADSPWATAIGGTSFSVPNAQGGGGETGWGTNQTQLSYSTSEIADPPLNLGNVGGSGGGESIFFAKPSWQSKLPGTGRQVPDVAALADPYTGVVIVYTDPVEGLVAETIGGTSAAAPIFSGFWALANQKAGHLLGQAAPIITAIANSGALHDITPFSSPSDVVDTIVDSSGSTFYSAADLAQPLEGTTKFVSAIWPVEGVYVDLTFGTDTSLQVAPGWDNVTGYGTPVGLTFIDNAAKQ